MRSSYYLEFALVALGGVGMGLSASELVRPAPAAVHCGCKYVWEWDEARQTWVKVHIPCDDHSAPELAESWYRYEFRVFGDESGAWVQLRGDASPCETPWPPLGATTEYPLDVSGMQLGSCEVDVRAKWPGWDTDQIKGRFRPGKHARMVGDGDGLIRWLGEPPHSEAGNPTVDGVPLWKGMGGGQRWEVVFCGGRLVGRLLP